MIRGSQIVAPMSGMIPSNTIVTITGNRDWTSHEVTAHVRQ